MKVYEKVRKYIDDNYLKQKAIAEEAGYNPTTLSAMLTGRRTMYADDLEKICRTICKELGDTYAAKNADYGSSFSRVYERFGLKSAVIRLSDKLYRLEALCDKEAAVPNESVRDTLMDMANYCIMAVMEIDKGNADE